MTKETVAEDVLELALSGSVVDEAEVPVGDLVEGYEGEGVKVGVEG